MGNLTRIWFSRQQNQFSWLNQRMHKSMTRNETRNNRSMNIRTTATKLRSESNKRHHLRFSSQISQTNEAQDKAALKIFRHSRRLEKHKPDCCCSDRDPSTWRQQLHWKGYRSLCTRWRWHHIPPPPGACNRSDSQCKSSDCLPS